tara:strand:- start:31541 stop:31885 length:345 start_codon:yes stop_codon:yes gene_type:complete
MTYILLAFMFFCLASNSFAKAFTDATYGDPKINPGTRWDLWHTVGRIDMYLDGIGWSIAFTMMIYTHEQPWYTPFLIGSTVTLVLLAGKPIFRYTVKTFAPEKYERWYGDTENH